MVTGCSISYSKRSPTLRSRVCAGMELTAVLRSSMCFIALAGRMALMANGAALNHGRLCFLVQQNAVGRLPDRSSQGIAEADGALALTLGEEGEGARVLLLGGEAGLEIVVEVAAQGRVEKLQTHLRM